MNTCLLFCSSKSMTFFLSFYYYFLIFGGEGWEYPLPFYAILYCCKIYCTFLLFFKQFKLCKRDYKKLKKKKKKDLTQCTKLLLLRDLEKVVMVNNFIYFKNTEQSNISFYKENIFVKLYFSTVLP